MTDTITLRNIIKQSGYKLGWIAEQLNLSRQGLDNKLNNLKDFRQNEIITLCKILNIDIDTMHKIFFAENVDK